MDTFPLFDFSRPGSALDQHNFWMHCVRLIQVHTCIQNFAGSSAVFFLGRKKSFFLKKTTCFLGLCFIIAVPIVKLFASGLKKAHVMMLPTCPLWYYDDPFTPLLTWSCAKHFTVQPPSVPIYTNDRHWCHIPWQIS